MDIALALISAFGVGVLVGGLFASAMVAAMSAGGEIADRHERRKQAEDYDGPRVVR